MNKISVIMLTYNRENLLSRMIECILAQTFQEFEFIIVDNGSTDRSGDIAEEYSKKDSRIKVIHREKGNIGSGRNAGLDRATGEYIGFVDDDDQCDPDYLKFLYDLIQEQDSEIAICGATWSKISEKTFLTPEEAIITLLHRKKYNVAFPTKLFKKSLFDENRFLDKGKYDDIYLMPKILSEAQSVAYHGESKYHFFRHEQNNSAWTQNHQLLDRETLEEYLTVYQQRTQWLIQKFPDATSKWQYFYWSFLLSMVEKVTRLNLKDCYEIREFMLNELCSHRIQIENCEDLQEFEKEYLEWYVPRMTNGKGERQ